VDDNLSLYGITQILVPLVGAVINIIAQYLYLKLNVRLTLLRSVYMGFFSGLFFLISFELYIFFKFDGQTLVDSICLLIVNLIIYGYLGYQYLNIVALGETARRIRIMREIYEVENGLAYSEILENYNAKQIIKLRLDRLINNGQIVYRNGRYFIENKTMVFITKLMHALKLIIIGKGSEFE
jgi:hypothetical protein